VNVIQKLSDLPNFTGVNRLVFDYETSGVSPYHGDRIAGIGIGPYESNLNFYIPIRHRYDMMDDYVNLPVENVLEWLRNLASDPAKIWTGHNLKYELHMSRQDGIEFAGKMDDTMILAHVIEGSNYSYDLTAITRQYVSGFEHVEHKKFMQYLEESQHRITTEEGKSLFNYSLAKINRCAPYCCEDLSASRFASQALWTHPNINRDRVKNSGNYSWTTKQLVENEMELIKVLFEMESNGVRIDEERCVMLRDQALDKIESHNDKMFKICGRSFSIASWKEMWKAFESIGGVVKYWSAKEKGKQKADKFTEDVAKSNGRPCWNGEAILRYLKAFKEQNNVRGYDFVLNYYLSMQLQRIVATNLDTYLKGSDGKWRLHGQFHQHRVLTGRLSSSDPNLQNLIKQKGSMDQNKLEKFLGRKDEDALGKLIRSLFIAERGNVILSQDYSQIEYRAAAYFSRDEAFLKAYRDNPDMDYHEYTAKLADIPRDWAKTVNFGTLYGMGVGSLASLLGIPRAEAQDIWNKVFAARPALRELITRVEDMSRSGHVKNPFGRWVAVHPQYLYTGLNYLCQGTVGDMMRYALVRLHKQIKENRWPVKMLLTVHDDLDYEMPVEFVEEIAPQLAKTMCDIPMMPNHVIPIMCESKVGPNWGQGLKPLNEWLEARKKAA
jgi:DNA polymerase I